MPLLLAALWLLQEVQVAGGTSRFVTGAAFLLLAGYFTVAFIVSRTGLRIVAGIALAAAIALTLRYGMLDSLVNGAKSAVLFVAFLASMQMLKVAIELGPGVERARRDQEALDAPAQHDAMLLRSWLVASIFAAGTLAIVSPLVSNERPPQERAHLGQAALQGVGLALLWSPFFVAMAVCTRLTTGLTLGGAVANGIAMSVLGVIVSHLAFGGRLHTAWMKPLARVFAGTVAMTLAVLTVHHAWGLGNSEAIVVIVPLVALVLARRALVASPRNISSRWLASLQAIASEALLAATSLMLGEVIKDMVSQGLLQMPAGMAAWPEPVLVMWPTLAMLAVTVAGFHPIIGATLLLPLQSSLPTLHPVVAGGSVLAGWGLSILLSRFSIPVMFTATMFGVDTRELVLGRMLRFGLLFAPVAWIYLWGINRVLLVPH